MKMTELEQSNNTADDDARSRSQQDAARKRQEISDLALMLAKLPGCRALMAETRTAVVEAGANLYAAKVGFARRLEEATALANQLGLRSDHKNSDRFIDAMAERGIPAADLRGLFVGPDYGLPHEEFSLAFTDLDERTIVSLGKVNRPD